MEEHIIKIQFNKTTSSYYETVVKLAKKFKHFHQLENTNEITLDMPELYEKSSSVLKILGHIRSWKYTNITFDDIPIDSSCIGSVLQLLNCANNYEKAINNETHCHLNNKTLEGWHCKYISEIKRHRPHSMWEYNHDIGKFWFDFGSFDNDDNWVINKELLLHNIFKEVDSKKIYVCPYYNQSNVRNIVDSLPDKINLNENDEWEINEKDIDNGFTLEKRKIGILPKNIFEFDGSSGGLGIRFQIGNTQNSEDEDNEKEDRNIPNVTFDEIGGLGDSLREIREFIELPLKDPELFRKMDVIPHKGILLSGPPGCGKTLIDKAIAREVNAHFIAINGPELLSKWYGETERNLRNIFREAIELAPSIIFFDEIDSIAQRRSGEDVNRLSSTVVNQLLTLMDGFIELENIKIIATTNRPELLDEAIKRPGRFDYHIKIDKPTLEGCKEILVIYTKNKPIDKRFDIDSFSRRLIGLTGADIAFIAKEAAYNCIRRHVNTKEIIITDKKVDYNSLIIIEDDFIKALQKVIQKTDDTGKIGFI